MLGGGVCWEGVSWEGVSDLVFGFSWSLGGSVGAVGERQPPNLENRIWTTQRVQVNVASLRLFLRSSTGPNRAFEPQSLGRVRDPVRIAEGPTHDFGFSSLDFGLRTEATRVSLPEAPARGEGFLVNSLHARIEGLPLLVFVAHVVECILAPGDFNRLCVDLFNGHREGPASSVN